CFLGVFFFQAEDGIRDFHVTGVQTCALPISAAASAPSLCTWRIGRSMPKYSNSLAGVRTGCPWSPKFTRTSALSSMRITRACGRSEERRVGEAGRARGAPEAENKQRGGRRTG